MRLLLLSIILIVAGCSHTYGTLVPGVSASWEDESASLPRLDPLHVDILVERTLYDDLPSPSWLMTNLSDRRIRKKLLDVIREFPSLASASPATPERDVTYRLTIEATDAVTQGVPTIRKFLFPVLILPYTVSNSLYLRAQLYHLNELLGTYEASGNYRTTYHILLLLTPWRWHPLRDRVADHTIRQLYRQIQHDMPALIPSSPS